jgi:hypothetical protein
MKYLPKDLINELNKNYEVFQSLDVVKKKLKVKNLEQKAIEKNAMIHSYRIEFPYRGIPFCIPHNNNKKCINEGIQKIKRAFVWALENFDSNNFCESFIKGIAGRVTPELYDREIAKYRERGISIKGASVTPPYPSKMNEKEIPLFIESMKKQLTCPKLINIIETAIYSHLHLVRIHPFVDGNGRTSRTLQNVILRSFNIPLPVIEVGEREIYYQLLDKAVLDWDEKEKGNGASKGEQMFYTFIAGKINMSFDKILEGVKHLK